MQMRKVLLVHISSSGCCNALVTMLNNGDFWLSILFHYRVFHHCRLVQRFPLPRFQRPRTAKRLVNAALCVGGGFVRRCLGQRKNIHQLIRVNYWQWMTTA